MKKLEKGRILIIIMSVITLVAVGISVWAVCFRDRQSSEKSADSGWDYAPRQIEQDALPISENSDEKMSVPEGGGAVSLTYSNEVSLSLSSETAEIMFQNPGRSNQDIILQLYIDDKIIAESGRIIPGYKLEKLDNVDVGMLEQGAYKGRFIVIYYDSVSGERAIVNTEIPVTVTVSE